MSATVHQLPVADPTGVEAAAARIAELERELKERDRTIRDLEDQVEGYAKTVKKQSREIGSLTRKVQEEADPASGPKGSEATKLVERWLVHHPQAKRTDDRIKLAKKQLGNGYPATSEEWLPDHPTLELAIDGIASHPYLLFGKRHREGKPSNRYDDFKDALGDGAKVEAAARAGYAARKSGWTPDGWPEREETK